MTLLYICLGVFPADAAQFTRLLVWLTLALRIGSSDSLLNVLDTTINLRVLYLYFRVFNAYYNLHTEFSSFFDLRFDSDLSTHGLNYPFCDVQAKSSAFGVYFVVVFQHAKILE